MKAHKLLNEIRNFLEKKYDKTHVISPLMIDPKTLGLQIAILEKTNIGVERKFDLILIDRSKQIKNINENPELEIMETKLLLDNMMRLSNEISKGRVQSADHNIVLSAEYIQQQADERQISFDDMVVIIQNELKPK